METSRNSADEITTRVLNDQFDLLYAEAVMDKIHKVARTVCYGCKVAHLSQTQHSCIMLSPCQKLERYFETIMYSLNDSEILCAWNKCVQTMDIESCKLEGYRRKLFCDHWRNDKLTTDMWKNKLFRTVWKMIKLEDRFHH